MTFRLIPTEHAFDSARDAIDAVSKYESTILVDRAYEIDITSGDGYVARVYAICPRESLGFLAPDPAYSGVRP